MKKSFSMLVARRRACANLGRPLLAALVIVALTATVALAGAGWKENGILVSRSKSYQYWPTSAGDGEGGVIITWYESRDGAGDCNIYAQRLNGSGERLWGSRGIAVCTAPGDQVNGFIAADHEGFAYITWMDSRKGGTDAYAQKLDSTGKALWQRDGAPVSTAVGEQYPGFPVPDGEGGAIVEMMHEISYRKYDIYAQKINADGSAAWPENGVPVCDEIGNQEVSFAVADGAGGIIAAWDDMRSDLRRDIYAQRINRDGERVWNESGVPIGIGPDWQEQARVTVDGEGGAFIFWAQGPPHAFPDYDQVRASRIDSNGTVQWNACLRYIPDSWILNPWAAADRTGGAVVIWEDYRGKDCDIYAQKIGPDGFALWPGEGGTAACVAPRDQFWPCVASTCDGGAFVTWTDYRFMEGVEEGDPPAPGEDVYAQFIAADGNACWSDAGAPVSKAPSGQFVFSFTAPAMIDEDSAVQAWMDGRYEVRSEVFAQRLDIAHPPRCVPEPVTSNTKASSQFMPAAAPRFLEMTFGIRFSRDNGSR